MLCLPPRVSFSPSLTTPLLSPLQGIQGMGKGGLWSSHITAPLCCSLFSPRVSPLQHDLSTGCREIHTLSQNCLLRSSLNLQYCVSWHLLSRQTPDKLSNAVRRVNQGCLMRLRFLQKVAPCPSKVEHVDSVAAGTCTRRSAADAHRLAWSQG